MSGEEYRKSRLELEYIEPLSPRDVATPFGLMRFRLTYDGDLPAANRRTKDSWKTTKWRIRQQISDQLIELYETHPVLNLKPRIMMFSHDTPPPGGELPQAPSAFREPIDIAGRNCIPLVRKSLSISCALDVLFLRRQKPGKLIYLMPFKYLRLVILVPWRTMKSHCTTSSKTIRS